MFGIGGELDLLVNGIAAHDAHSELAEWARVEGIAQDVRDPERELGHESGFLAHPLARLQELLRRQERAA